MSTILKYILDMLPYMFLTTPIYLIIRVIIKRKKTINWYYELTLFIFVIFLIGLLSQTIIPKFEIDTSGNISILKNRIHKTNLIPFKVLNETYIEVFKNKNINYFLINFIGNIIIFMPIGFFIPLLWKISNKKVIIIGCCLSLFIEFCQLFLARGTDIDDVILNTIGVCLGFLVYKIVHKNIKTI